MFNLYTETAFQVTPVSSASVIHLHVPRSNGTFDRSKAPSKDRNNPRSFTQDEETYAKHYLATESSIYFRKANAYPRTFWWRVVGDGKVLEIQCADLARAEGDLKEAYLTLSFTFQDRLLPMGVAFADLDKNDEIHVFACTQANELFDLKIPTKAFRDRNTLSGSVSDWCSPVESSTFSVDTAHHVYATSSLEFFVSFISGRIQRLKRRSGEGHWVIDNYHDTTWMGSIRGFVGRRVGMRIEHGSQVLDGRTAQAMTTSPDGNFLFTICLNHTLRVWHLPSGQLTSTNDLLGQTREPQDMTHLSPSESAFLQWFKPAAHKHPQLLTYSPQDGGQFKFWEIRGGLTDSLTVEDKFPGAKLTAPDPDPSGSTIWSLTGVRLYAGNDLKPAQLWALWRNHNYHQLYTLSFEFADLTTAWNTNWVRCAQVSSKSLSPDCTKGDVDDPASKWLDFMFSPGRYSAATLETALSIFEEATSVKPSAVQVNASLQERLCAVVAASVSLRKYEDADMDFDRFVIDTDTQWRNLYRIVERINDERQAPLSLLYDAFSSMVWITMADKCCAVRECSNLELLQQNELASIDGLEDFAGGYWPHRKVSSEDGESFSNLATLIRAARAFREAFSAELSRDLALAVEDEMAITSEVVTPSRVSDLYDALGLSDAISNDVFDRLEADLAAFEGAAGLSDELFIGILELIQSSSKPKRAPTALRNTLFGSLLFSAGVQDMISAVRNLLLDLLALTIFVEGEFNQEDVKMSSFDAADLFERISSLLKLYDRSLWLTRRQRTVPLEFLGAYGSTKSRRSSQTDISETRVVSIFEDTLSKAVRLQPAAEKPLTFLVTDQIAEMNDWATETSADEGAVYLQCDLLIHEEYDLAMDFLHFQSSNHWSTYVKGRLALAKAEFNLAARYFRKASYGLSCGKAIGDMVELSAGLISTMEAEAFNNGLPRYFQHITTLFEASQAWTQTAQFARLALQSLGASAKDPTSNFRTDVLSRLFVAELKSSNFASAYAALVQLPDPALQRSSVMSLANSILNSCSFGDAVKLFTALPWGLHPRLQRHLDEHLGSLAKRQNSLPSHPSEKAIDYLSVVHALRIAQKDFRGAVAVLFDRLRLVRRSARVRHDPQAMALREALLGLINALACVKAEDAYILADVEDEKGSVNGHLAATEGDQTEGRKRRRVIITIEDLRKEYQSVLDRCARIERGDFDFDVDGDETDDDEHGLGDGQSKLNIDASSRMNSNGRTGSVSSHQGHSRAMAGDAMEF